MRARHRAKVGAACRDDAVHMVGFADRTDGDSGDAGLVADAVGKGCLVHAAVRRLLLRAHLAGGAVDHVRAGGLERPRDGDRVGGRDAAFHPVVRGDAHRDRQVRGPHRAHGREHLQRVAQAARQIAAIGIVATVGERRDEAGEQVAVGTVQFEPVEASLGGPARSGHEVIAYAFHVFARHRARHRAIGQVGLRRGREQRPVAFGQRLVGTGALPRRAGAALGPRVPDLDADLRVALAVHVVHDALPGLGLRVVPQPWASRRDARVGRRAGHLRHHQPGAAHGTRAQMHEVEVARHAVHARVLRHGRDHHAVLQRDPSQRVGREHRRYRHRRFESGTGIEPALEAFQPALVAQAQVLVADALAAREHGVHELLGFKLVTVALAAHLEPLHGVPGGVLQTQHIHRALGLIARQHGGDVLRAMVTELAREFDRVLQRQLGARADGEVRRVHGVTHQHDMAAPVEVRPLLALHALEVQPGRAAQVARIGHQLLALQVGREQPLAEIDGLLLVRLVQPMRLPHVFRALDDEGGGVRIELVDVRLEPAVLGLLEQEGEGVVQLVRAQPDVAVGPRHDVGAEDLGVAVADARVDAVARDDEVGIGIVQVGLGLLLEHQFHAQRLAAGLQDVQQLLAADAHEAVAAGADDAALEVQLDVVPVVEGLLDLVGRGAVPLAHVVHGGVGEHHAPAEGVVGLVALHHRDVVRGILLLHQQGEVKAGRAAADAHDLHACSRPGLFKSKANGRAKPVFLRVAPRQVPPAQELAAQAGTSGSCASRITSAAGSVFSRWSLQTWRQRRAPG